MIAFAALLDRLMFAAAAEARIALLRQYFAERPDPERGWALAVLIGAARCPVLRPADLRSLAAARLDPALFQWSRDFVGDMAETIALMWPATRTNAPPPDLSDLLTTPRATLAERMAGWLDASDPGVRLALLKLTSAGARPAVSGPLVRRALAALGGVGLGDIETVWHRQTPPYSPLFAWLEGRAPRPAAGAFRPFMLADPLHDPAALPPGRWWIEPYWDGERVLLVRDATGARLFSRQADDISAAHRACLAGLEGAFALDGVLSRDGGIRLFDMLSEGAQDLRPLPLAHRRARLEAWFSRSASTRLALSDVRPLTRTWDALCLLKRADSLYVEGRGGGAWLRPVQPDRTIDTVLMYIERGTGTVGVWRDDGLVPVGKVALPADGALAAWIASHTIGRFGPVREVEKSLVITVAFTAADRSSRHKAGVVLRDPRVIGVHPNRPAKDATWVEALIELDVCHALPQAAARNREGSPS